MSEGDVSVTFQAVIGPLLDGIEGVKGALDGLTEPITKLQEAFSGIGEAMLAGFAVERIEAFAESMAKLGLESSRISQIMGIPIEDVASLGLVANATGTEVNSLETAFGRMSRNVINETEGTKRALDALGLSFSDLKSNDTLSQLELLADRFSKIKDGAEKDAIAMELLGRTGVQMIPLFNEGAHAIGEFAEMAERAGTKLDEGIKAKMEDTHLAFMEMNASFSGAGIQIFSEFGSAINGVVKIITDLAEAFTAAMKEGGMMKDIMTALQFAARGLVEVLADVVMIFRMIWTTAIAAIDGVGTIFVGLGSLIIGVFQSVASGVGQFFSGLYGATVETAKLVGGVFEDLGNVIASALTGHISDASAAIDRLKANVSQSGSMIGAELNRSMAGFDFQPMQDAWKETLDGASKIEDNFVRDSSKTLKDWQSELGTIWKDGGDAIVTEEEKKNANMAAAQKKGVNDAVRAALTEVEGEIASLRSGEKQREQILNERLKVGDLTNQQWLAATKATLDQELAAEIALYNRELAIDGLKASEKQAVLNKITAAQAQHDQAILQAEIKTAEAVAQEWQKVADKISGAVNSQVRGLLNGTTSFAQAFKNIMADLVTSFIEDINKMIVRWLIKEAIQTTASVEGAAARTAAEEAGTATSLATMTANAFKAVMTSAGQAFAGVTAFMAPIVGPAAPSFGAAAEAEVIAGGIYDAGSWSIPNDQFAAVHAGEVIIPSRGGLADEFRSIMSNGGFKGSAQTNEGPTTLNRSGDVHFHVNAIDGPSVVQHLKSQGREIAKIVAGHFNQNPSLRPTF